MNPSIPSPRPTTGLAPSGRRWTLTHDDATVTATVGSGAVAEACVSESDERVVVEFWAEPIDLTQDLAEALVGEAFSLPAVRPGRPVVVCVPQRHGLVLTLARRLVRDARVRSAGVTCLVEGRVSDVGLARLSGR